jgi:hypothetical protein
MRSYSSYTMSNMSAQEIDQYVKNELRGQYALLGRSARTNKVHRRKDRPMWRRGVRAILAAIPVRS